jgi:hypothetical protein
VPLYITKAEKEAQATTNYYHTIFPTQIKKKVDQMDVAFREKRKRMSNEQI